MNERLTILKKSNVSTVICGGISGTLQHMLERVNIHLISGIAGQVDQVLAGYLSGELDRPCFHMPGSHEGM